MPINPCSTPHLVKGTSTIRIINNGRSPIGRASARIGTGHVNTSSKFRDQLVTNLGTRVLWRPTEVSQRRMNWTKLTQPIQCKSHTNPPIYQLKVNHALTKVMPIQCQSWKNLKIHHQFHHHLQSTKPMSVPVQSTQLSHRSMTNNPPNCINSRHSNQLN